MNCGNETLFKQFNCTLGEDASKIVKCNRPEGHDGLHAEKDENNVFAYVWTNHATESPAPTSESE